MKEKKNSSAFRSEKRTPADPIELAHSFRETGDDQIRSDVDGSYTGTPRDGITPIQDVDDL